MDCIFCKIAKGDIKDTVFAENENFVAFDDINPVAPSHVLVIPRKHIKTISELALLGEAALKSLPDFIEEVAGRKELKGSGFRVVVNQGKDAGQEVEHLHFHILGGKKLGKLG